MASLTIRKLDDDVKQDLRELAARHGRSVEDEARHALKAHVRIVRSPRKSMGRMLFEGSRPGIDLPVPPRTAARIPRFDEE
jgi:antitoxin FitA